MPCIARQAAFQKKLAKAAIENLFELGGALSSAVSAGEPGIFDSAVHTCKMTLLFVNDPELTQRVAALSSVMRAGERPDATTLVHFHGLIGLWIDRLRKEAGII